MKKAIIIALAATMTACAFAIPAFGLDWQSYLAKFTPISWHWDYGEEEADSFTIEYDCAGGGWFNIYKSPAFSNSATYEVEAGEAHKTASAPTRGGYAFAGWEDEEGNVYKARQPIVPTNDMKLTATWAARG